MDGEIKATPFVFDQNDLSLFPSIVPKLNITRIILLSSNCERGKVVDQHENLELRISFTGPITVFVNTDVKQAWAHIGLDLVANPVKQEIKDEIVFKITAMFEVRYDASTVELSSAELHRGLKAFCHLNSPSHVWPFLRQFSAETINHMGLPAVMLPLLLAPMLQHQAHVSNSIEPPKTKPDSKPKRSKK